MDAMDDVMKMLLEYREICLERIESYGNFNRTFNSSPASTERIKALADNMKESYEKAKQDLVEAEEDLKTRGISW